MANKQYAIEIHVTYQKEPIVHNSSNRGSYDNRHFYNVYENSVNGIYKTTHRYPIHSIIKIVENIID